MRSECPPHSSGDFRSPQTQTRKPCQGNDQYRDPTKVPSCTERHLHLHLPLEPPQDGTQSTPYTAPTGPHAPILLVTRVSGPP